MGSIVGKKGKSAGAQLAEIRQQWSDQDLTTGEALDAVRNLREKIRLGEVRLDGRDGDVATKIDALESRLERRLKAALESRERKRQIALQQAQQAQQAQAPRLKPFLPLAKGDACTYFRDELLKAGNAAGGYQEPDPATEDEIVEEVSKTIISKLGGGGGEYGEQIRSVTPGLVRDAYNAGYRISVEAVRTNLSSLISSSVSAVYATTIGTHDSSQSRGMSMFNYDEMR